VDGGVRSSTNADLIAPATPGARLRVLVLAPLPTPTLEVEIAALRRSGADVALVTPDERSRAALGGPAQILDPNAAVEAARAGRDQAFSTPWLRDWWSGAAVSADS
jgi:NTE family protein